jgi:ATP-dependent Clp protease ATP-binding subunit ClpC
VFERFTERARQVVVLAQDEAHALKHNYLGTEHLLLGLLREQEGLACRALESLGMTLEEVRGQVARIVGPGDSVASGQIPFTPRAKKVLELSLREAISLEHNYIGTEHLLLAIAREGEGVGASILRDFEVDYETARNALFQELPGARPDVALSISGSEQPTLRHEPGESSEPSRLRYVAAGWAMFGVALGIGVLVGWLIWG